MRAFRKIINPGKIVVNGRKREVFIEIGYSAEGVLTLHGVIGPWRNGNCAGCCGQIRECLKDIAVEHKGWRKHGNLRTLQKVWERWHLNGYMCGRGKQEVPEHVLEFLRELPESGKTPAWV